MVYLKAVSADLEPVKASPFHSSLKTKGRLDDGATPEKIKPQLENNGQADAVCDIVDECQKEIRQRTDGFFTESLNRAAPWVEDLLDGKKTLSQTPFYDAVLSQQELDAHIDELRRTIQRKVQGYFGATALAFITKIDLAARVDVLQLHALFTEYQRTLLVMSLAAEISNRACQQSFSGLKTTFLLDRLVEKVAIGSQILKMANCCPRQNRECYRTIMIPQVKGVVQAVRNQLTAEACYQAAVSFYELYDLLGEPHEKKTDKPGKSARPLRAHEEDPQGAA